MNDSTIQVHVDIYQDVRKKWRWRFVSETSGPNGPELNIEFVKTDPVDTLEEAEDHFHRFVSPKWVTGAEDIRILPVIRVPWYKRFWRRVRRIYAR